MLRSMKYAHTWGVAGQKITPSLHIHIEFWMQLFFID